MAAFDPGKTRALLLLWGVSLLFSAALVAAGRRWPAPLLPQAATVWSLLLLPPLLTGLAVLLRGRQAPAGERGESGGSTQERQ